MATKKKEYEKIDYREQLSEKVKIKIEDMIQEMETNPNAQWSKPWFSCNERPINPITGTIYKGINVVSLMSNDFNDNRFYSFNNVAEMEKTRTKNINDLKSLDEKLGTKEITHAVYDEKKQVIEKSFVELESKGLLERDQPLHVLKGSKATAIYKAIEVQYGGNKEDTDPKEVVEDLKGNGPTVWIQAFAGNVFNASQISNIKPKEIKKLDFIPIEEADIHLQSMIAKTDLSYTEANQGRAYYRPGNHSITMPLKENFSTVEQFYGTLLHEIGHSTGPHFKRDQTGEFGSKSYAKEELVAEISSVLMSADLGIPYDSSKHENHLAYLKSWVKALDNDKNFIFSAASQAEKSVSYQHEIRHTYKQEIGLTQEHKIDLKVVPDMTVSPKQKKSLSMSV